MKKRLLFLSILYICLSPTVHAQLFDVLNKPMYEARVKLLDEFHARFNGTEQRKDVDEKYSDRKSNILMLFDLSRFKSKDDTLFIAAETFAEKVIHDSILLNYTDSCWFAKVKCHGLLAKKGVDFLLYLSVEKRGKDMYKWVISDVDGSIFSTSRSIDHKELFLYPNDHEQSFASLVRTTEETCRYIDDFVKDGYESAPLSVFLTLVRCGQLKIEYVSDVEFVYLQVPEYIFSVKHFERETMNAGWLISSIEKCDEITKVEMLNNLHHTPACITARTDTIIKTKVVLDSENTDSIIQGDTIFHRRQTDAEKIVRRFWDNLRLWCETKDIDYIEKVRKECHTRECRVNDNLMKEFVQLLKLPEIGTYTLDSYLLGFQSAGMEENVDITIGEIKEIDNSKDFCIVSCSIKVVGAFNVEARNLFYIRKGKVSKIISNHPIMGEALQSE